MVGEGSGGFRFPWTPLRRLNGSFSGVSVGLDFYALEGLPSWKLLLR